MQDLSDNSKLTLENLNSVFSDQTLSDLLVRYLDGTEEGLQQFKDTLAGTYGLLPTKIAAVI